PFPSARGAALVLSSIGRGGTGPVAEAALLKQLANTARALHDAHRAAGDAQRAAQIAATVRDQLRQVDARVMAAVAPAAVDEQAAEAVRLARRGLGAPRAQGAGSDVPPPAVRPPNHQPQRDDPER
ncbi:MAG: relaxase, partial [Actinomycetota bacterium]|nr:relaxase [Actinomycetota bacterium]